MNTTIKVIAGTLLAGGLVGLSMPSFAMHGKRVTRHYAPRVVHKPIRKIARIILAPKRVVRHAHRHRR